ncbi:COG4695 Phage-related protein [uncultured Caudovirales phage]|uniref:COG4695 Phage-related protein n=2 Tax=uncultured Caudovirales phage TaxID=2100421 RepID=A0A6J5RT94_9CAUD|nr:COG4695 Phage-related protein [uncultured Caudovirales phage]CAB4182913.1 COG4695 Phage-related protein [uncultured Caudovirales phage]CAB4197527.1 COG4695 Phage-related protein [uncultured Caudovirales phage]CAB4211397.1 COG4695 Phage-related protein [uncultured Caudovirales phage]
MTTSLEAFEASMSGRVPTSTFGPQAALAELDLWGSPNTDGVVVNDSTALTLMPFLAGVTLIAESMTVMPLNVYRKRKSGGRDIADQHPAQYCLQKTNNGWMTPSTFKSFSQGCLLLSGNSVGEIVRNGRGQATEIHHWLPRNTQYGVDSVGNPMYGVVGSPFQNSSLIPVNFGQGGSLSVAKVEWFPYSECIHLKGFSTDGFIGRSPLASARNAIALSLTIEQFGMRQYTKGRPAGWITKPEKMTKDQRDQLREEWREMYEGVHNAHKVGVLSGGMDWKQMGFTNDDAQFLQTRQFQVQEIARMLRIPPHMIGDLSQATETNIEQLFLEFLTVTLQPWMTRWQEELNLKLFTPMEQFTYEVEFDLEAFLRGDKLTQANVDKMHLTTGQRTIDETRLRDGFNPYEEGIGSKPLIMASQLDTLENVIDGTSLLHGGQTTATNPADPANPAPAKKAKK